MVPGSAPCSCPYAVLVDVDSTPHCSRSSAQLVRQWLSCAMPVRQWLIAPAGEAVAHCASLVKQRLTGSRSVGRGVLRSKCEHGIGGRRFSRRRRRPATRPRPRCLPAPPTASAGEGGPEMPAPVSAIHFLTLTASVSRATRSVLNRRRRGRHTALSDGRLPSNVTTALYRRYRPRRSRTSSAGARHRALMQALRTGRVNHAYLFSGPGRGAARPPGAHPGPLSPGSEQGPTATVFGCATRASPRLGAARKRRRHRDSTRPATAASTMPRDPNDTSYGPAPEPLEGHIIDEAHSRFRRASPALRRSSEPPCEVRLRDKSSREPGHQDDPPRTHHYRSGSSRQSPAWPAIWSRSATPGVPVAAAGCSRRPGRRWVGA